MRIAVCDDEKYFRDTICEAINAFYQSLDVLCLPFEGGGELINAFEKGQRFDAVFLDIEMPPPDGMETARRLHEFSPELPVIFLTSHTELAMDGYEAAAYFLLADRSKENIIFLICAELFSGCMIGSMQTAVFSVARGAERSFAEVTLLYTIGFLAAVLFVLLLKGLDVGAVTLCTVLSNLLDNAIEAAAQTDTERVVTLSAKKSGSFYYICINNPTANYIDVSADIPTSKPDGAGHGLGLKSARKAIEKCGGTLELSCKEAPSGYTFTAEVILPQEKGGAC